MFTAMAQLYVGSIECKLTRVMQQFHGTADAPLHITVLESVHL